MLCLIIQEFLRRSFSDHIDRMIELTDHFSYLDSPVGLVYLTKCAHGFRMPASLLPTYGVDVMSI